MNKQEIKESFDKLYDETVNQYNIIQSQADEISKLKERIKEATILLDELRFYPLDHGDYDMMERIYDYEEKYEGIKRFRS